MQSIANAIENIQSRVRWAAERVGRDPDGIKLLAVSKNFPANSNEEAFLAGQLSFGESRLQEAESKIRHLDGVLDWHFIGNLQRNKVRKILPLFPTIHSVSSFKLAQFMDRVASELDLNPKIFLEVNIGDEESKHGFEVEDLEKKFPYLLEMKHLNIQGLMSIPPITDSLDGVRPYFRALKEFQNTLIQKYQIDLPELSMGMSGDFEIAVEEGSTIVRVGSAIFGRRG